MSYKFITNHKTKNRDRGNNHPCEIIIHHWGVDGQDFDNVVRYLCSNNNEASAHYVVQAGRVAKLANTNDTTWHAGNYFVNSHSLGIECRPEMTDGDLKTLIELISNIYRKYGVMPLRGHKDVVPTACPGRYYKKLDYIEREAKKLYNAKKKKKPAKKKTKYCYYCSYITNMALHFRTKADLDKKYIICTIPKNTKLKGTISKGWLHTNYKGKKGYVKVHK